MLLYLSLNNHELSQIQTQYLTNGLSGPRCDAEARTKQRQTTIRISTEVNRDITAAYDERDNMDNFNQFFFKQPIEGILALTNTKQTKRCLNRAHTLLRQGLHITPCQTPYGFLLSLTTMSTNSNNSPPKFLMTIQKHSQF